jgi:hypothetical protein
VTSEAPFVSGDWSAFAFGQDGVFAESKAALMLRIGIGSDDLVEH